MHANVSREARPAGRGRKDTVATMSDEDETLAEWAQAACAELGIDWDGSSDVVTDMAGVVARAVSEPAATLSAFLLGLVVGHGHPVSGAAVRLRELAEDWERAGGRP